MSTTSNLTAAPGGDAHQKYLVYLGSYGQEIHAYRFDAGSGSLTPIGAAGEAANPSWLATDRDHKYLYAVDEVEGKQNGGVTSFSVDRKTGKLRKLNHVSSEGTAPCHVSVDASGKMLVVANYSSGDAVAFPIKSDGSLGEASSVEKAHGTGADPKRQEGSHAHEAVYSADNKRVYVPDLGLDKVRIYKIDPATAKLTPNDPPAAKSEPGSGPRHMVFDHKSHYAYVLHELKPIVAVFRVDPSNGNLEHVQTVGTIKPDFKEENSGAEIRIDPAGKFIYTSNRGEDSIQVFAIDQASGKLQQVQNVSTGGKEPRGFAIDPTGHFLLAGNQKSDSVVVFRIDQTSGKLTPTGTTIQSPKPVDVLFIPAR